ncbi:hypothetical protein [Flavobacterium sp. LC2016-01]|uniref:hypothetical protein n=1 Tax=Flavobacterium sp. LC2016-01 TaxID=2675876 RepID=UPI0012BA8935|nr:hypothetical protein [Flavobacterium sp. LC2016-01]MTH16405.1 hypothetical protein [Flavobacterium sp. LC2016-01]
MKLRYLALIFINALILFVFLNISVDKLETILDDSIFEIEIFKIIGFTILSLIGIRILVSYFRRKKINSKSAKQKISALLIFAICSVLYINYSQKIIENRIVNQTLRRQISQKIKFINGSESETKAENLTFEEYEEIIKIKWFPKISKKAKNISYYYWYDGFLPDHSFILKYNVPKNIKIKTFDIIDGDFTQSQKVEMLKTSKKVEYLESEQ